MRTVHRPVALLCIVVVAVAPLLPGVCAMDFAPAEPSWILLADLSSTFIPDAGTAAAARPLALLSLSSLRAPPTSPVA